MLKIYKEFIKGKKQSLQPKIFDPNGKNYLTYLKIDFTTSHSKYA